MIVGDIMTRYVEFLEARATVQDAAVMMGELDVGGLPVGTDVELEGIITDRDILFRVVAAGLDPSRTPVQDVLSRPPVRCRESDSLQMALDIMAGHHIRRLPVQDDRRVVVGWVTLADLSRKLLLESGQLQTTLTEFGAG
jgi:CBS domain-containing protein